MESPPIISLGIAEDHKIVRRGIINLLSDMPEIKVDFESPNGQDLIYKIETAEVKPDVCIIDINMPVKNGFDTVTEIRRKWPSIGILILTVHVIELYVIRMIACGANGYLLKNCDVDELRKAINNIYKFGMYFPDRQTRHFFNSVQTKMVKMPTFTPSEEQLIRMSCTNLSYEEIAKKLGTTTKSVEGLRDNIFRKLKVGNRIAMAMFAIQFGYVSMEINTSEIKSSRN